MKYILNVQSIQIFGIQVQCQVDHADLLVWYLFVVGTFITNYLYFPMTQLVQMLRYPRALQLITSADGTNVTPYLLHCFVNPEFLIVLWKQLYFTKFHLLNQILIWHRSPLSPSQYTH